MSLFTDKIKTSLGSIQSQKENILNSLAASKQAIIGLEPEVESAINTLIAKFGDVQQIGNILGAKLALQKLEAAAGEVAAIEALMQASLDHPEIEAKAIQKLTANTIREAANS